MWITLKVLFSCDYNKNTVNLQRKEMKDLNRMDQVSDKILPLCHIVSGQLRQIEILLQCDTTKKHFLKVELKVRQYRWQPPVTEAPHIVTWFSHVTLLASSHSSGLSSYSLLILQSVLTETPNIINYIFIKNTL